MKGENEEEEEEEGEKKKQRIERRYRPRFNEGFVSAVKRFCEFELKFLQATAPLLFSSIIVPHRIHVALFFLPSVPLVLSGASATRRKPIRDRHPAERQRLFVYPRSPSKCEVVVVVVGYADRSNEALRGAVSTTFRRELCIWFGIYFIYHSCLSAGSASRHLLPIRVYSGCWK